MMFVTVFLAILNIRTGELVYTNAGHNPPYLKRANGELVRMDQRHGPALGPVEEIEYGETRDTLGKEDMLLLYTDGVTEAMDPAHRQYEEERLVTLLESRTDTEPEELIKATIVDLNKFVAGAEQFDDITLLALRFEKSPGETSSAKFRYNMKNRLPEVEKVLVAFEEFGKNSQVPESVRHDIKLAFDELLNNTVSYGYTDDAEHEIQISIDRLADRLDITIIDDGIPFDPLQKETPNVKASMEERGIGGLGIFLVRKLMDDVSYKREDGKNILTLVKLLDT
jgi:sigma-B regulation protein RsbU (phosphoserine phosphatase)